MEAVIALINASSDKFGFFGGIVFLLIVIFCKNPVTLGTIHLPAIDRPGRIISGIIGCVLVLWAVFVWTAQSNVGLFSRKPLPNSIVLKQDQPKKTNLSDGEEIGAYAYNITSSGSANIVLFKLDGKTGNIIDREISYASLKDAVGPQIIWEGSFSQTTPYKFSYNGREHILRLDRVDWFLVGPDYVVVTLQ